MNAAQWVGEYKRLPAAAAMGGAIAGAALPPANARVLLENARRLIEQGQRDADARPPTPDHTIRNLMAAEALHAQRVDRERALARQDIQDDDELLRVLNREGTVQVKKTCRMISLVARYAGELQHILIHPDVRESFKTTLVEDDRYNEMMALTQQGMWYKLVDPGLSGNARIACQNIENALPQLHGITVDSVIQYTDDKQEELLDFFCAAVAARWRANTVFAAGPYKTRNEQAAVTRALNDAVRLLGDFFMDGNRLKYTKRPRPPTSLNELRALSHY
jgi:hypothetical protein